MTSVLSTIFMPYFNRQLEILTTCLPFHGRPGNRANKADSLKSRIVSQPSRLSRPSVSNEEEGISGEEQGILDEEQGVLDEDQDVLDEDLAPAPSAHGNSGGLRPPPDPFSQGSPQLGDYSSVVYENEYFNEAMAGRNA